MTVTEIRIVVKDVSQFLLAPHSLFYHKRKLSSDAEEIIIEEASMVSSVSPIHLQIVFDTDESNRKEEIPMAIQKHFAYLRQKSEQQLKGVLHRGWQSLLISIVFYGLLVFLILIISKLMPESGLSITLREILIVLGWVALWRPADLLLYEWRPFKREINLFRRLEQCEVEIFEGPPS